GEGTGATYDPQSKELRLKKDVKLTWRGRNPKSAPMLIEAGELIYKEAEHKVWLLGWSKFARGTLKMDAGPAEVTIEEGAIRLVTAIQAKGVQTQPERTVEFAADELQLILREGGLMEKITGQTNAKLNAIAKTGRTETVSDRLDLSFADIEGEAVLKQAVANGRAQVKSIPGGQPAPDTRVLKADAIELKMRGGGGEIETVDTHSPGTIEFLPNRPGPRYRKLDGERMNIRYGNENRIEYFRAVKAATRTDPDPNLKGGAPQLTWSDDLEAYFDAKSGDLSKIEQWGNFRYRQGERQARAERASMVEPSKVMTLTGGARVWDAAGSTEADRIAMNQTTDDVEAAGKVRTVREPNRAAADRMTTTGRNAKIRYEGRATVWQGQNRLDGDVIDIDRTAGTVAARGHVVNLLQDRAQPVATVVRSQTMHYLDRDRVAFYEGDVHLTRPQLDVRAKKLRAYLSEENAETGATLPDSGLDKAFAEGQVAIVQTDNGRTRTGTGEEADYAAGDGKVVLMGGSPKLVETIPGAKPNVTMGRRLTWFGNSDKLLVEGASQQPASSTLRRKKPASPSDR
ncbi:MAG: LptA/OstA family protein, partial [Bryobacteraceae bacterium]|nr:LptA/OstA family protein [Bryobacteraceae bacterium]